MRDRSTSGGGLRYVAGLVLLLCALWIGLKVPDADQSWLRLTHLFVHRSLLTHGLLLPLFLLVQFHAGGKKTQNDPLPRLGLLGLLLGLSAHFAFDLFPRGWWGYALIYVPLYGRVSPLFSEMWLVVSLLLCLYGACRLLRGVGELYLAFVVLIVAFVVCAQTESNAAAPLPALLALALVGGIAFVLPRPSIHPETPIG